ncbi:hypothetical protein KF201_0832 [Lactococcus lactis subsp. lactis]|uniref:Uncharacterized protein n=1 Tax=Lactococcus lactis subsp. lactis TaxID=1360 RepID=A0A0V8E2C1_LACLL|nr:hypothetical protein KF201_0832 [Lactococcus lactis subsp. lactis]KSU19947.1 hypothetical protein M20_1789 [Lactococcus lactis subsp. lactis]
MMTYSLKLYENSKIKSPNKFLGLLVYLILSYLILSSMHEMNFRL